MAQIKIGFDKKSIQKAIEKIKLFNASKDKLLYSYLENCIKWIRNRADQYLLMIPMDGNIIAEIMNGWIGEVSSSSAKLINTSDKAVFVEFGVGRIAKTKPHPNATDANYEYDIPTDYKTQNGYWTFSPDNSIGVDIQVGYYKSEISKKSGDEFVTTQGSPASLYLFNAIEDFKSTQAYKKLWNEAVEQVLKR